MSDNKDISWESIEKSGVQNFLGYDYDMKNFEKDLIINSQKRFLKNLETQFDKQVFENLSPLFFTKKNPYQLPHTPLLKAYFFAKEYIETKQANELEAINVLQEFKKIVPDFDSFTKERVEFHEAQQTFSEQTLTELAGAGFKPKDMPENEQDVFKLYKENHSNPSVLRENPVIYTLVYLSRGLENIAKNTSESLITGFSRVNFGNKRMYTQNQYYDVLCLATFNDLEHYLSVKTKLPEAISLVSDEVINIFRK